jgi:hypothetical protein
LDPAWQDAFDRKANAWPREASPYPVALNPIRRENFKIKVMNVQENAALLLSCECEETECLHQKEPLVFVVTKTAVYYCKMSALIA